MEYDLKAQLIDQLQGAFYPEEKEEERHFGGVEAKFIPDTGSIRYVLSGTEYSAPDIIEASEYYGKLIKLSVDAKAPEIEIKRLTIAKTCIDAVIKECIRDVL